MPEMRQHGPDRAARGLEGGGGGRPPRGEPAEGGRAPPKAEGRPAGPRRIAQRLPDGARAKADAGKPALTVGGDSNIGRRVAAIGPAKPPPPLPPPKAAPSAAAEPSPAKDDPASLSGSSTVLAAAFCPMPAGKVVAAAAGAAAPLSADAATVVAIASPIEVGLALEAAPITPLSGLLAITKLAWVRWLVLGSAPLLGLGLIVLVWSMVASHRHGKAGAEEPGKVAAAQPPQVVPKPPAAAPKVRMDRRWLPSRTALVFSVQARQLASQPQAEKSIHQLEQIGHVSIHTMLRGLGLTLDSVQRMTWAASDLAIWPEAQRGDPGTGAGARYRRPGAQRRGGRRGHRRSALPPPPRAAWPNLLVVVDRQTIVTGEESLLRALGRQGDAKLESGPLGRCSWRRQSRRRRHVAGRSGRGQGGPLETAHRPVGRVAGAETASGTALR